MKNRKLLLVMICVFTVLTAYGELPPREWWHKIGFSPYTLYRSSDLIGEGQITAVEEMPPFNFPAGGFKFSVIFTNMLKGSPGKYEVIMPEDMRATKGYYVPPPSIGATIDMNRFSPVSLLVDTNGMFCGKSGQGVAMVCQKKQEHMELHAILPPEQWATFPSQLAEGKRQHEEWVKAKKARKLEIDILELKLKDSLELGDISQEEYDQQNELLEPLKQESRKISSELWNDRADYKYYDESQEQGEP